jgi:rod shape-determining protein MreD
MKKILIFICPVVLAVIQLSWPPALTVFNVKPDLLFAFSVSLIFYFDFRISLAAAVFSGLLKDAFLPQALAVNTLLFAVWGYLAYRICSQVSTENNYIRFSVVLMLALLNNAATGLYLIKTGSVIPAGIFLRSLVFASLYTVLAASLMFKFIKKLSV